MKKLMTMALGLSLVLGSVAFAAQGQDDSKDKKTSKKKGGKKKSGGDADKK